MTELPKRIWLNKTMLGAVTWNTDRLTDTDIKYIRADRYAALLDAAVSLHHWLFEMMKTYDDGDPRSYEREMLDDAQLALNNWNRFCDGKAEEEG